VHTIHSVEKICACGVRNSIDESSVKDTGAERTKQENSNACPIRIAALKLPKSQHDKPPFGRLAGEFESPQIGGSCRLCQAKPSLHIGPCRMCQMVAIEAAFCHRAFDRRQAGLWPVAHAKRHRPIEHYHR
jgi:hypothetical protein